MSNNWFNKVNEIVKNRLAEEFGYDAEICGSTGIIYLYDDDENWYNTFAIEWNDTGIVGFATFKNDEQQELKEANVWFSHDERFVEDDAEAAVKAFELLSE
jgi:hypothetical protein